MSARLHRSSAATSRRKPSRTLCTFFSAVCCLEWLACPDERTVGCPIYGFGRLRLVFGVHDLLCPSPEYFLFICEEFAQPEVSLYSIQVLKCFIVADMLQV